MRPGGLIYRSMLKRDRLSEGGCNRAIDTDNGRHPKAIRPFKEGYNMPIVNTLTRYEFADMFDEYGRGDNFSYEGRCMLFDYLEEMGGNVEMDVIGLCCDFSEMTLNEASEQYDEAPKIDDYKGGVEYYEQWVYDLEEFINDNTLLVGRTNLNTLVFADF